MGRSGRQATQSAKCALYEAHLEADLDLRVVPLVCLFGRSRQGKFPGCANAQTHEVRCWHYARRGDHRIAYEVVRLEVLPRNSMRPDRRKMSLLLLSSVTAGLLSSHARAEGQTPSLTKKEVKALIATAKTPEDHRRLAAYYHSEAVDLAAKQQEHEEELQEYFKNSSRYSSKYPTMGDHCRGLAGYYGYAAKKAQTLADMHEGLAKQAEQ